MANAYFYSNVAQQTTLTGSITSGSTTLQVAATTGFPPTTPYVLAVDYGAATEELVSVTGVAGTSLTVSRGFGGTSAQSHSLGALVRHVVNAQDLTDFRSHEASTGAVHGLTGSIVGTSDTQTLSNKTLTNPTLNSAVLSGTFTGTPTFSGDVTHSGQLLLPNLLRGSRALASDTQYESRVTGDANARWFIRPTGEMNWGPGTAGTDTILFRSGSNTLQTNGQFRSARPAGTDAAWISQRSTDMGARWYVTADGVLTFGDGAGAMDTNVYRSAANTLQTDDSLVIGGNLSVGGINQVLRARKTTDTNVTSNATVADDPHLVIPIAANAVYELEGLLLVGSNSITGDIRIAISAPTGVLGSWSTIGPSTTSNTDPDTVRVIATQFNGGSRSYGIPAAAVYGMPISGMVESPTAGNLAVQWAQVNADPIPVTLHQYSWIRLTRVA